jgi:hypothetical protein
MFFPPESVCPLIPMATAVFRPGSRPPAVNLAITDSVVQCWPPRWSSGPRDQPEADRDRIDWVK